MNEISVCVICQDEEESIARLLDSVATVADEIVVVDSGSTDRTEEVCRRYTDKFIENVWPGYRDQKQFATDQASCDWILSLDADEELSKPLQAELKRWKDSDPQGRIGYTIPRLTYFLGGWVRHTTWYPDRQLRLFRKDAGRWSGGRVHESFQAQGDVGRLQGDLFHWTYSSLSEYVHKLDQFSSLAAADYRDRGKVANLPALVLYPLHAIFVNLVIRLGFLDGGRGLVVSLLAGVSVLMKYLKLWELQRLGEGMDKTS